MNRPRHIRVEFLDIVRLDMKQVHVETLKVPRRLSIKECLKQFFKKINFEFMDVDLLPSSLRSTLRDILEVGNGAPFRNYYQWTSKAVFEYARKNNLKEIVELGAGCAPITKHLIRSFPQWDMKFKVTDLNPDIANFKDIERSDRRVKAEYQSLDFTKKIPGFENSLLVLSATFHHVSEKNKKNVLSNLKKSSPHVMIFEPLRFSTLSIFFVITALFSGFLTPLFRVNSSKFLRCLLWCWLVPIAPLLFLWDGWISVYRCWSKKEWLSQEPQSKLEETLFCTKIILSR